MNYFAARPGLLPFVALVGIVELCVYKAQL